MEDGGDFGGGGDGGDHDLAELGSDVVEALGSIGSPWGVILAVVFLVAVACVWAAWD